MAIRQVRLYVAMLDGTEHDIACVHRDLVAWDRTRVKHKWPTPEDAPFVWMEFLAWHHLVKTTGTLPDMTLSVFGDQVKLIASRDDEDDEADVVDPTNPEPVDG